MAASQIGNPSVDEYYQDYMMVLEVFDKMEPEQSGHNAEDTTKGGTSEIAPANSLNGAFDNTGILNSDGGVYPGMTPGMFDPAASGRAKREKPASNLDMDNHALTSLAAVNYGGYSGHDSTGGQYLDPASGLGMNAHLMPSTGAAGTMALTASTGGAATGTKKRGASTVDDLLSHVAMAKQRRRERNKVLARKTRIKKKVELEQLKSQIDYLTNENSRLRQLLGEAGIEYQEDKSVSAVGNGDIMEMMQGIANDSSIFSTVLPSSLVADGTLAQYPPLPAEDSVGHASESVNTNGAVTGVVNNSSDSGKFMDDDKDSGENNSDDLSDGDVDGKTSDEGKADVSDDKASTESNAPPPRATRTSSRRAKNSGSDAITASLSNGRDLGKIRITRNTRGNDKTMMGNSLQKPATTCPPPGVLSEIIDADTADPEKLKESLNMSRGSNSEDEDVEDGIIRCCVVEDSVVQAKLMCKHLLSLSTPERVMKVYRTSSGENAVDFLEKKGGSVMDLWFIDQNLGHSDENMKGSDVIAKIRSRPENATVTIVGVTTNPLAHFVEMNAAGVDMVWGKEDIDNKGMTNKLSRLIIPKATTANAK